MWARIDNGVVAELADIDPTGRFHPSLQWIKCDADVKAGMLYDGKKFSQPVAHALSDEEAAESVRAERDALLRASDWVALRAVEAGQPVPKEWAEYRQALRDVPQQEGFPRNIKWPDQPSA